VRPHRQPRRSEYGAVKIALPAEFGTTNLDRRATPEALRKSSRRDFYRTAFAGDADTAMSDVGRRYALSRGQHRADTRPEDASP